MTPLLDGIQRHWLSISAMLLAGITLLSLWPSPPSVPGGDKLHHTLAYALLAMPAALARTGHPQILLLYLGWSGAIELIQPYVHRQGEWADLAANASGLALGWLLGTGIARLAINAK
ncbi:MAG: VanZ family protein [Zetaproteobacteria bacterium]|nr:MAG: VanZ family protein [Zetaproteobacteria bacterium]